MDEAFVGGFFALFCTLVGGLATYISTNRTEQKRIAQETEVLSQSISAEIKSVLNILINQDHGRKLREAAEMLRAKQPITISWSAKRAYSRVYDANVGQIGKLRQGAGEAIHFYNDLQSLLEGVDNLPAHNEEFNKSIKGVDECQHLSQVYDKLANKFDSVVKTGEAALKGL